MRPPGVSVKLSGGCVTATLVKAKGIRVEDGRRAQALNLLPRRFIFGSAFHMATPNVRGIT